MGNWSGTIRASSRDVNQVPYEVPGDLEVATLGYVGYYNHRRHHKALSNVTPNDALRGRRRGILIRKGEVKAQTSRRRQRYNRQRRESYNTATSPDLPLTKVSYLAGRQQSRAGTIYAFSGG